MLTFARSSLYRHAKSIGRTRYTKHLPVQLAASRLKSSQPVEEVVSFPSSVDKEEIPVLLNSNQHVVGYLSKVLNARCYDVAVETQLQEAKSLSMVRLIY